MANQQLLTEAIVELTNEIADTPNPAKACSDFNGWTVADSMGYIADAMLRIADALEGDTSLDDYANMQNHIVDLNKEEA